MPDTTLKSVEDSSPEALLVAVDTIWPYYNNDLVPKEEFARHDPDCRKFACALDAFRREGVEKEQRISASERDTRQRCEATLRKKDEAMGVLFARLNAAGVDCSDLIS